MRIMWAAEPSTQGTVLSPAEGSWVGDIGDFLIPPRDRFARISRTAGQSITVEIDPPTTNAQDLAAFVFAFRVPYVDISAGDGNDYWIKLTPLVSTGGASISESVARADISVSGASPFISISAQTAAGADFANVLLTNADDTFFPGWIVVTATLTAAGVAAATTMEMFLGVTSPNDAAVLDVGFCGWMRSWEVDNLDISSSFAIDPDDPSIKQFSDGGQLFATNTQKRRSIAFDFRAADEDSEVITTTPQTSGIMTLADQIGTTQPSFWIPDQSRSLSPSMNILGTVREWPSLNFVGNDRWSMSGIVVDELL